MIEYELEFLDEDWAGAGLDLEYVAIFREPGLTCKAVLEALETESRSVVRWSVASGAGDRSGESVSELRRTIKEDSPQTVLIFFEIDGAQFYAEVSTPNVLAVGGPSEAYYTGREESDRARVERVLALVFRLSTSIGPFAGSFGAEGVAEQMAQQARAQEQWIAPARGGLGGECGTVLEALRRLRGASR